MKKLVAFLFVALLALGYSACGGNSSPTSPSPAPGTAPTPPAGMTPTPTGY